MDSLHAIFFVVELGARDVHDNAMFAFSLLLLPPHLPTAEIRHKLRCTLQRIFTTARELATCIESCP